MTEEEQFSQQPPLPAKRTVLLTVLCVLTFIYSAITIISSITTPMFAETSIAVFSSMPQFKGLMTEEALMMIRAGWTFYMILLLLTSVSLTGAILMWNLRKAGFHFYTIANIFVFCLPSFMLHVPFNIGGLIFPGIFIALYGLHYKIMQ